MTTLIVVVLLLLVLTGSAPVWGYSRGWGYGPSSIVGFLLLACVVYWLLRHT